jgi:hypothetical protein
VPVVVGALLYGLKFTDIGEMLEGE